MTYNKRSIGVATLSPGILTSNTCILDIIQTFIFQYESKSFEIKRIGIQMVGKNCTSRANRYRGDLAYLEGA